MKMKVKIFNEYDEPQDKFGYCKLFLENRINDFIKDKKVIDIKYQAQSYGDGELLERALVMYEEE